ncbi:hypothetical protein GNF18_08090 [Ligilactobacillus pobuzihii]|uniref:hypothetical protein n=1 Tax=Ligilactobacillus pobuzihii TaxID=449659 RepID=UPI0019D1D10B|nr:hypothetical protein [Ligilactobacillus pobuzihii]MBN7275095.1 hypothetical protein [Ligilactobacillus pobuzihii]
MPVFDINYKPDEHLLIADGREYQVVTDISINFRFADYCTLGFSFMEKNNFTGKFDECDACIECLWPTAEKVLRQVKADKNFLHFGIAEPKGGE